jgi:hypothetical protein
MNMNSNDAVIVSYARTALGKSFRGGFNTTHGAQLGKASVAEAVRRAGINPGDISDVLMGCGFPEGPTGFNIARQISIAAGLGNEVPGIAFVPVPYKQLPQPHRRLSVVRVMCLLRPEWSPFPEPRAV